MHTPEKLEWFKTNPFKYRPTKHITEYDDDSEGEYEYEMDTRIEYQCEMYNKELQQELDKKPNLTKNCLNCQDAYNVKLIQ
jgi:hypothetical protein